MPTYNIFQKAIDLNIFFMDGWLLCLYVSLCLYVNPLLQVLRDFLKPEGEGWESSQVGKQAEKQHI